MTTPVSEIRLNDSTRAKLLSLDQQIVNAEQTRQLILEVVIESSGAPLNQKWQLADDRSILTLVPEPEVPAE
mgnify:FL=1|jgi:hypothetical protein